MKSLQEIILEKLKLKNVKKTISYISKEQLEDLFLYCQCFLKEEECREDCPGYINWGEMERFSEFNIDWTDKEHKWISEIGYSEDPLTEKMDIIGNNLCEIFDIILNNTLGPRKNSSTKVIFSYIIHYLIEYFTSEKYNINNFNLEDITSVKYFKHGVTYTYDYTGSMWDRVKSNHYKGLHDKLNIIANTCKEILE